MRCIKELFVEGEFYRFTMGDPAVFRKVFDYYFPIIIRYTKSKCVDMEDAEDLAQEAFTLLFLHCAKVNSETDLYPYLFVITKRLCISHLRKKIGGQETIDDAYQQWSSFLVDINQQYNYIELERILYQIVDTLPPQQQEVYKLSQMEDLSHQTIANQMGISKNTVRNHLHVATKIVRLKLEKIYTFLL